MKMTLAIPFMNMLNDVKGIMGLLKHVTSSEVEWLIIDNGSTDDLKDFFLKTLKPKRVQIIRNPENIGMVATYNQIFKVVTTDLVAVLHNDVYVYEKNWDERVVYYFRNIDRLGMLGFFGAAGVGIRGERIQDGEYHGQMSGMSNLLEARHHGFKLKEAYRPTAILDGFAMVMNMGMIKQAGGLDTRYYYHHLYDRDLPLTSLALGYKNIVAGIPCHHHSGMTANRHEYQVWIDRHTGQKSGGDNWTLLENARIFAKKWAKALPLYIEPDFTFRKGRSGQWDFKGDAILKYAKARSS